MFVSDSCALTCSLGHLLNILFTLSHLLITEEMNIVVYYVIQCGNDDIYVRSFIFLCLGKVRDPPSAFCT